MVDILTYRHNIGVFRHGNSIKRKLSKVHSFYEERRIYTPGVLSNTFRGWEKYKKRTVFDAVTRIYTSSENVIKVLWFLLIINLFLQLTVDVKLFDLSAPASKLTEYIPYRSNSMYKTDFCDFGKNLCQENFRMKNPNFSAKYTYGNKAKITKRIKNMHLNIRSLSNKIFEVKRMLMTIDLIFLDYLNAS